VHPVIHVGVDIDEPAVIPLADHRLDRCLEPIRKVESDSILVLARDQNRLDGWGEPQRSG
jgi:hypothetical protein